MCVVLVWAARPICRRQRFFTGSRTKELQHVQVEHWEIEGILWRRFKTQTVAALGGNINFGGHKKSRTLTTEKQNKCCSGGTRPTWPRPWHHQEEASKLPSYVHRRCVTRWVRKCQKCNQREYWKLNWPLIFPLHLSFIIFPSLWWSLFLTPHQNNVKGSNSPSQNKSRNVNEIIQNNHGDQKRLRTQNTWNKWDWTSIENSEYF